MTRNSAKILMVSFFALLIALLLVPAFAGDPVDYTKAKRLIIEKNAFDKSEIKFKGCHIRYELADAFAIECPKNAQIRNAIEDEVLYVQDIQADQLINADDVWVQGYTGSGVVVAVLDTGIDTDHPELADSIAGGKGFGFKTFEDDHGHGTHVSGIITANGIDGNAKGVAPDARIWMGKVCSRFGLCYASDVAAAIEYIVNNNIAKIISMSLGHRGTQGPNCDWYYLAKKVNWAVKKGVTVVAAAGNSGNEVFSPACASKAIAVGSVNKSDLRSPWSGSGEALDIVAPGEDIYSSKIDGYRTWSGTSMATPHVSAVIALLLQKNPSLNNNQIKDALYKTANDLGDEGWDRYYGFGRVDALGAINYFIFSDNFENGLNNWIADQNWVVSKRYAAEGRLSAEVNGDAADATLTMANLLDLDGRSATLTFSWFIKRLDKGEYLCADIYSKGAWDLGMPESERCLDGDTGEEGVWHHESFDLSNYLTDDFRIRFRATASSSRESGYVDNVAIVSA